MQVRLLSWAQKKADDAEYLQGEFAGVLRQVAAVQNGGHVRQVAVHMRMMMPVFMFMLMMMLVFMPVFVFMMMFMGFVRMLVFERRMAVMMPLFVFMLMMMLVFMLQLDVERTGVHAVRIGARDRDGITLHVQAVEGGQQFDFGCAEVEQRGHGHVAADPGGAFEVKDGLAHGWFPCMASALMRAAR